jgi:diaminopimelate decarboxylase
MLEQENQRIINLANKYDTPFYLYDSKTIKNAYRQLQSFCGNDVDVFYSLKANPNQSIVALLNQLGAGAEVCSTAEFDNAIKVGVLPDNIILVGPYKHDKDIEMAIKLGIYAIVCESMQELKRIAVIAANHKAIAKIMIRINPDFNSKDALLKMGGKPSQFGMDIDSVNQQMDDILACDHIQLIGIHIYNGTRILDSNTLLENTKNILAIAETLQHKKQIQFSCVDIGGGAGIPYFDNESALDLEKNKFDFQQVIRDYLNRYANTKIIMESGRYLVGESGCFISRIHDIKHSKGKEFIVTDGGTNCHLAAVGVGSVVKRNFPISIIPSQPNREVKPTVLYDITGPLCTPNDLIAKNISLPQAEIDDLICIKQSGAYGPTASPVYFLSHGYPAEVMIHDNQDYLIRKRDSVHDINHMQINIYSMRRKNDTQHIKCC